MILQQLQEEEVYMRIYLNHILDKVNSYTQWKNNV